MDDGLIRKSKRKKWYLITLIIIGLFILSGGIYMFKQQPEQVLINQEQNNPLPLKSSYVSQILPLSNQDDSKYIVIRQDGNESFYDVTFDYITNDLVNINFKLNQDKIDKEGKTVLDYSYQPSTKATFQVGEVSKVTSELNAVVADKDGKIITPVISKVDSSKVEITKDTQVNYVYTANPNTDKYLKFGDNSIVIVWNISYSNNMNGFNVTSEPNNMSHLMINNQPPYDNLIGYWNFDSDVTNNTAYDFSNNHKDGQYRLGALLNNTPSACKYDDCITLDGVNDFVFADATVGNYTDNFTISLWIKQNDTANTMIMSKRSSSCAWNLQTASATELSWYDCKTSRNLGTIAGFRNNSWFHIAVVIMGNNSRSYVNGQYKATFLSNITTYSTANLLMGGWNNGASPGLNGSLDDIMVFNSTLNASQILQIYNGQSARFYSNGIQQTNNSINITVGNNRMNVSLTSFENNMGTNISLALFYYTSVDDSWHLTPYQNITQLNTNYTYNITTNTSAFMFKFNLLSDSYGFYSPILGGNAIIDTWNVTEAGAPSDDEYPQFSNYLDNNASIITSGIARFNVTVGSTNGTVLIQVGTTNYSTTNLTATMYNLSTTLTTGTYPYYWGAWGNGTSKNYNSSSLRYYTVNSSGPDTTAPYFTGIPLDSTIIYGENFNTDYNATDAVAFGTFKINNSKFTINQSGWLNNNSPLQAGVYNLNVSINDTTGNTNSSIYELTVSKADAGINMGVIGSVSLTYGTPNDWVGTETNEGDGDLIYRLNRYELDEQVWYVVNNPDLEILRVGTYDFIYNTSGGQNYSMGEVTYYSLLVINKAYPLLTVSVTSPISYEQTSNFLGSESNSGDGGCSYNLNISNAIYPVGVIWTNYSTDGCFNYSANSTVKGLTVNKNNTFTLAVSRTTPISYEKATDFSGSGCPSQLSCLLNLTNQVYQAGTIWTNYSTVGNANYSAGSITSSILINKNSTYVLGITRTTPITYGTSTDFTGSGCTSQLSCSLNLSNQVYPVGTIWANYSSAGNTNYSSGSAVTSIVINKATGLVYMFINGTRSNKNYYNQSNVWLNGTLITGQIGEGLNMTIDNTQLNFSTSRNVSYFYNFSLAGTYTLKANYTGNQNYTPSYEQWTVTITNTTAPAPPSNTTVVGGITPQCKYKKFGFYNINLPWLREVNCI